MTPQSFQLDRLVIRAKGLSASTVEAAVRQLPALLARQMQTIGANSEAARPPRIDHLEVGPVRVGAATSPSQLAGTIAAQTTAALHQAWHSGSTPTT